MMLLFGPFRTFDLILTGLIIAVLAVIAFLAKGLLSTPIYIAGWIILLVLGVMFMLMFLFVLTIFRYWMTGKEGFLFSVARATGQCVYVDSELGSGVSEFVLGEKESPKDITFKDTESGIKVDPSQISKDAKPMRFPKGLDIYLYSFFNIFPQSVSNHAAFQAIEDYFNASCKDLHFLHIKEFVELISDPEHYLEHNASVKLSKYFKVGERKDAEGRTIMVRNDAGELVPQMTYVRQFYDEETKTMVEQDLSLPEMMKLITQAKTDIAKLPCHTGPLAGDEAFKNNPIPFTAQYLQHVIMLLEQKMALENPKFENILLYCIGGAILFIGGGLGFYIVSIAQKCGVA